MTRPAPPTICSGRLMMRCTRPKGPARTKSRRHRPRRECPDVEISRDILIVDDDRQVREVLHQIFQTAGYKCRLAQDGRAALKLATPSRPPLTVTDLKM